MTERVARLDLRIDAGPEADAAELAVRLRRQLLAVESATRAEQRELITAWIDHHTGR